jgi:hypothetical protein
VVGGQEDHLVGAEAGGPQRGDKSVRGRPFAMVGS